MQTHDTSVFDDSYFAPSYNVAPQSLQPVVRLNDETGERELTILRWGLVPFFSKDGKSSYSTINARSETVTTSAIYRGPMKGRRCLVPATGFYEWQATGEKTKQPWDIELADESLFAFAGLWERWTDKPTGRQLETYTVLTTDPNELMSPIHNRMPVILAPEDYARWLEPGEPSRLPVDLLQPYSAEKMKCWKVGAAVGNVRNNRPELREPVG